MQVSFGGQQGSKQADYLTSADQAIPDGLRFRF